MQLNFESLDQIDERIFLNSDLKMTTPIKLISPLSYNMGKGKQTPPGKKRWNKFDSSQVKRLKNDSEPDENVVQSGT